MKSESESMRKEDMESKRHENESSNMAKSQDGPNYDMKLKVPERTSARRK